MSIPPGNATADNVSIASTMVIAQWSRTGKADEDGIGT